MSRPPSQGRFGCTFTSSPPPILVHKLEFPDETPFLNVSTVSIYAQCFTLRALQSKHQRMFQIEEVGRVDIQWNI